jgi:hypothetical protein
MALPIEAETPAPDRPVPLPPRSRRPWPACRPRGAAPDCAFWTSAASSLPAVRFARHRCWLLLAYPLSLGLWLGVTDASIGDAGKVRRARQLHLARA